MSKNLSECTECGSVIDASPFGETPETCVRCMEGGL